MGGRPLARAGSGLGAGFQAASTDPGDLEMGEIGLKPMLLPEELVEWLDIAARETQRASAARAGEVDVARFLGPVIFDPTLEVGVGQDAELVEQSQSPVHGGGVASRHALLDLTGERRSAYVPRRRQRLHHDRSPLWGHAQPAQAKLGDDMFRVLLRHGPRVVAARKCSRAAR